MLNQGLVPLNLEVIALSEHAMAENLPPEPPPDLAVPDGCRSELTRTNLESSSVTVDHSKDFIHRYTNVAPRMAWTDEKHNSYLDALEASFIKQLHHSLGLPSWRLEQNTVDSNPSQQLLVNAGYSSDQFTFLRDGPGKKIKFERNQPLLYGAAGSHVVMESPRMRHFRCSGKPSTIPSADLKECNMFHSEGMPLRGKRIFSHGLTSSERQCLCHQCHQDAVGTMTEVSDQNFVDDDKEVKSSSLSRAKRLKMAASDASTEDQIVPSRIHFMAEISTASNPSSKGETIESFIFIETNVKSYLRES
ncbi:unnamed protein product [Camellia sinensis]